MSDRIVPARQPQTVVVLSCDVGDVLLVSATTRKKRRGSFCLLDFVIAEDAHGRTLILGRW